MSSKTETGITFGAFDLLHSGHLFFLKLCKSECSKLIVGLHVNPAAERSYKNIPIESVYERWMRLYSCKYVDEIIPYETEKDLINIINTQIIHKRFLDEQYKTVEFTGQSECLVNNIEIIFFPRKHSFSSTSLRNRIGC